MRDRFKRYILLFTLPVIVSGCDYNPVAIETTIKAKINANRPYRRITVSLPETTYLFTKSSSDAWNRIDKAYADDHYFVVVTDDPYHKSYYFNLLTVRKLEMEQGTIAIAY